MASRRTFLKSLAATGSAAALPPLFIGCSGDESSGSNGSPAATPADGGAKSALPQLPDAEPTVRVRIRRVPGERASRALVIGQRDQWLRVLHKVAIALGESEQEGEMFIDRAQIARGPLSVSALAHSWRIVDAGRSLVRTRAFETLRIELLDPEEPSIDVDGDSYPGTLALVARPDLGPGDYDVVNHVAMERYLPGVLARELFSHWHVHTFAAQAIAARSFASSEIATSRAQRHYDVTSTASSQAYVGQTRNQRAIEAIEMTRGMFLSYRGGLVSGYYSACCGGVAAAALDVISDHPIHDVPPLMGREGEDVCRDAPVYRWTVARPAAETIARLRAYGVASNIPPLAELAALSSVEAAAFNRHGRPTRFVLHLPGAQHVEMRADSLRRALDFSDERERLSPPQKPLYSSFIDVKVADGEVTIHGRGHGHGAGMCQYGAQSLATDGKHFDDILHWYYPAVEIVSAYS